MILLKDYTGSKDKLSCQNLVSSKPPAQQPTRNSGTTPSGCPDAPPRKKSKEQNNQGQKTHPDDGPRREELLGVSLGCTSWAAAFSSPVPPLGVHSDVLALAASRASAVRLAPAALCGSGAEVAPPACR